jgi:hypothetical protein
MLDEMQEENVRAVENSGMREQLLLKQDAGKMPELTIFKTVLTSQLPVACRESLTQGTLKQTAASG